MHFIAKSDRNRSILFLIFASILWSTGGLVIKWIPWHPEAISSFRGGISFLTLILFWRIKYGKWPSIPGRDIVLASISYTVLTNSFVIANKLTTSANAILLQYTAPAWVLFFSAVFLGEKIKIRDIFVVVIIFVGMSLFFVDSLEVGGMSGNLVAIFSGGAMAVMILLMRNVKKGSPVETVIWGNLLSFFVGIPFYQGAVFSKESLLAGVYLGVFQLGMAYLFYTLAIQHVSAMEAILIPVIEPLLNPVWVYFGTGEKPSRFAVIGGIIVIAAVLYRSIASHKEEIRIKKEYLKQKESEVATFTPLDRESG